MTPVSTAELYPYVVHDEGCVCTPCIVAILREVRGDYAIDPEPFIERLAGLELAEVDPEVDANGLTMGQKIDYLFWNGGGTKHLGWVRSGGPLRVERP